MTLKRCHEGDSDAETAKKQKRLRRDETEDFLLTNEIILHDKDAPPPCVSFDTAPFSKEVVKLLTVQFKSPSPIQAATWNIVASKRDVLAIAKTGSGKTLGYLLPALTRCVEEKANSNGFPSCLIMAPTRELAIQICAESVKYSSGTNKSTTIRSVALYGGAPKGAQINSLWRGVELIVATPGRMKDMLDIRGGGQNASTTLEKIKMLVLDEADRMLDMGFEKEIRDIIWQIPVKNRHQTLMYSATWPPEVERIAAELLTNPSKVTVGSGGDKLTANKSVTQIIHVVEDSAKLGEFLKLIEPFKKGSKSKEDKNEDKKKVIVFANTKADVQKLSSLCWKNGFDVDSISGDRSQSQRESVIKRFREGSLKLVIATDVCGRGLDIEGIERVINYDFPGPEDYIHRIGRTGRGGTEGRADSFFTSFNKEHVNELMRILRDAGQIVPEKLQNFGTKSVVFSDSDSD